MNHHSSPAVGVGERPASEPAPGAGQPNLTSDERTSAAFAIREYGQQCTEEFNRQYFSGIADKVAQGAS